MGLEGASPHFHTTFRWCFLTSRFLLAGAGNYEEDLFLIVCVSPYVYTTWTLPVLYCSAIYLLWLLDVKQDLLSVLALGQFLHDSAHPLRRLRVALVRWYSNNFMFRLFQLPKTKSFDQRPFRLKRTVKHLHVNKRTHKRLPLPPRPPFVPTRHPKAMRGEVLENKQ